MRTRMTAHRLCDREALYPAKPLRLGKPDARAVDAAPTWSAQMRRELKLGAAAPRELALTISNDRDLSSISARWGTYGAAGSGSDKFPAADLGFLGAITERRNAS